MSSTLTTTSFFIPISLNALFDFDNVKVALLIPNIGFSLLLIMFFNSRAASKWSESVIWLESHILCKTLFSSAIIEANSPSR